MRSFIRCGVIVSLSLVGLTGCGTYEAARRAGAMATLPDDRVFPVKPRFTVQPQETGPDSGIDFEAVYYLEHRSLPGVTSDGGRYLRFWPDGRVMQRFVGRKPAASEEADRFEGAWLGYYRTSEGKLEIEFFAPEMPDFRWDYWKVNAVVQGDRILMVRSEKRRRVEEINLAYLRHPVKGMTRGTDW